MSRGKAGAQHPRRRRRVGLLGKSPSALGRRVAARLVNLERERLAQLLHDTLTQDIWYAALLTERLRAEVQEGSSERALQRLDALRGLLAGHYLTARSIIASLRSGAEAVDLQLEIRQLIRRVNDVAPGVLRPTIDWDILATVANPEAVAGLVRELVTNAVKHSGASWIELTIHREGDHLQIVVADGGVGLPAKDAAGRPVLESLQARVGRLGGSCTIASRPGGGAAISVRLPQEAQ